MLDPKFLRQNIDQVAKNLKKRQYVLDVAQYHDFEARRVSLQTETQSLQAERNANAKQIGVAKQQGQDAAPLFQRGAELSEQLKSKEAELTELQAAFLDFQLHIPNLLDDAVPEGREESDNILVREWGEKPTFDFPVLDHLALGEQRSEMDFSAAAKLAGSRFVVLTDRLARLHRALAQFMLDLHTQTHGYQEVYVPYLVKSDMLYGTGQLPKFRQDQFSVSGDWDLTLIPTAEVPLTNLVREQIVSASDLPLKFTALTPCFRSEAGSYGKDTKGMIRMHQFQKVELVQIVRPQDGEAALETLTGHAEQVLQLLKLPYRVMVLCGGDTGFSARKTYDIEVWLPGQDRYREISSCSHCGDFQARRMKARYRCPDTQKPELVHTLNGSGVAVGRALIAVIENYQQADGTIRVPDVLQPYLGGLTTI